MQKSWLQGSKCRFPHKIWLLNGSCHHIILPSSHCFSILLWSDGNFERVSKVSVILIRKSVLSDQTGTATHPVSYSVSTTSCFAWRWPLTSSNPGNERSENSTPRKHFHRVCREASIPMTFKCTQCLTSIFIQLDLFVKNELRQTWKKINPT